MYYFGKRYYDPSIGRFLTPDPMAHLYPSISPY
ncbi:type IV secretion protein Rhs, partial [candidate division KSB1 bacterium]|nr:type IV secretion protein Rhs [candidate division KSB1 bacterium]